MTSQIFSRIAYVNNLELASHPARRTELQQEFSRALAQQIVNQRLQESRKEFHTEFRIDVHVLTPAELAELVQNEAQRLVSSSN